MSCLVDPPKELQALLRAQVPHLFDESGFPDREGGGFVQRVEVEGVVLAVGVGVNSALLQ